MRTLHIIPIVHTAVDLGSLADVADEDRSERAGPSQAAIFQKSVSGFWEYLNHAVRTWPISLEGLRCYQDSLPVTDTPDAKIEHQIVSDLAQQGSQNHLILSWLISQGAILTGTESPDLLLQEYELAKQRLESSIEDQSNDAPMVEQSHQILLRRDEFIANRIDQTLSNDSHGLLFIGLVHRVEQFLCADIDVRYPFGKPRFARTASSLQG